MCLAVRAFWFQVGGPLWAISSAHDSSLHVYLPAC